jgi:hypothetical protein
MPSDSSPDSLRESQDARGPGDLLVGAEQHEDGRNQGPGPSDHAELREAPRHGPRAEHHVAEHEPVADGGAEGRAEQERRFMESDQRPAVQE